MNSAPTAQVDRTSAAAATSATPLIAFDRVAKRFSNGTLAVEDFSLAIGQHEFVSLLGPSGCGKSTLLRMVAGLGETSGGAIAWSADHAASHEEGRHDIGFVFQEPTLMPWSTVRGNVERPLRLIGVGAREARQRANDALELVGLTDFLNAYPRALSGGMRMRVSIARAVATRPRVLLMDEPFAALDEITRFKLNADLLDLWRQQQWTVIFVTHSVFESVFLSNRVVVMTARPGRMFEEIAIDAPYPRGDDFRMSGAYNDYCRRASESLAAAMRAGDMSDPASR